MNDGETVRREDREALHEENEKNPARKRQERGERVEKPPPDTLDQTQEDVAHPESPIGEPRGN